LDRALIRANPCGWREAGVRFAIGERSDRDLLVVVGIDLHLLPYGARDGWAGRDDEECKQGDDSK